MGEIFGSPGFDHVSYRGSIVGVHASLSDQVGKRGDAEGNHLYGIEGPIGSTFRDLRVGGYAEEVLTSAAWTAMTGWTAGPLVSLRAGDFIP